MKKYTAIILLVILVVLLAILSLVYFVFQDKIPKNLSLVNNQKIIKILKNNADIQIYTKTNPDFKIESKEVLTKESIIAGQNGQNFKEVYQGLELEENRYIKIQLMNQSGNSGFVAVIDFNDNSVPKAFGLVLFEASASTIKNGQ